MKAFFVLTALVASAYAGIVGHGIGLHTGSSVSSRAEDGLGNYKFAYNEKHATGGTFRSEAGNPWGVAGSYGLADIDGRQRVVNYVADGHGFRASIKTNEPGTAPQAAAATSVATPGIAAVAKTIAAPVALAAHASYAAPVIAKAPVALGYGGYGHAGYGTPLAHSYGYGVARGAGHYYG
ncbi:cuticle protein 14-like [Tropilaelaps mercedesae]|uniref:Cuticle protein 14-like n=1 Tax=Tropilaelaps mercedesae TaxID=418985 RepID=A0A1V9WYG4_9ACAR|nr:cuticle protein 14-like [Tropilaelaps mercedesae]